MAPTSLTKSLQFEKKNQSMPRLPKHMKISKRPIPHPPTPSPYSGSSTPKTIYVSSSSPVMGVVKRVQKYLRAAENRATGSLLGSNNKGRGGGRKEQIAALAKSQEALKKEEVFVKATGRAMERALKVGKWFEGEGRAEEFTVRVKTGSVLVVDDVVDEDQEEREDGEEEGKKEEEVERLKREIEEGGLSKAAVRKRKRDVARIEGEVPETRTRWVNMVEVAVSLK